MLWITTIQALILQPTQSDQQHGMGTLSTEKEVGKIKNTNKELMYFAPSQFSCRPAGPQSRQRGSTCGWLCRAWLVRFGHMGIGG